MKTVKLYQARALVNHRNFDDLFYVDKVSDGDCSEVIFKEKEHTQLYSFWYNINDDPDLGTTIDTIQQFDASLDNINNSDLDVEVAPVKKVPVTTYKYVGDEEK